MMRHFQQNRKTRNIIYSKPVLIFLGILVLLFSFGVVRFATKMVTTRENKKIAEDKVAKLEMEKIKLSSDIDKLKTEEGKEETIRDKFGLAKEGEGVIVIVEDKNAPEAENAEKDGFFDFLFFWRD